MAVRLAFFGSHFPGREVLEALLRIPETVEVALVATDDPHRRCCNASKRIWRHDSSDGLRALVPDIARGHGIAPYTGRINSDEFRDLWHQARPEAILSCVFGQRIPSDLLKFVLQRAWNLHPVVPGVPLSQNRGPEAFERAFTVHRAKQICLTLHVTEKEFDAGREICRSSPVFIPQVLDPSPEIILAVVALVARPAAELVSRVLPALLTGPVPDIGDDGGIPR